MLKWSDIATVIVTCPARMESALSVYAEWPGSCVLQTDDGRGWRANQTDAIRRAVKMSRSWCVVCEDDVELGPELPSLPEMLSGLSPDIMVACLYCTDKVRKPDGWIRYQPFTSVCNAYRTEFADKFAIWLTSWWQTSPPYGVGWALQHFLKIHGGMAVRSMPSLVQHLDMPSTIWTKRKPRRRSVSYDAAYRQI